MESHLLDIVAEVERCVSIPTTIDYSKSPPTLVRSLCDDCSVLSCGCLVSENLAKQLGMRSYNFKCPACQCPSSHLVKPCDNVRALSRYLISLKETLKWQGILAVEPADQPDGSAQEDASAAQQRQQRNFTFLTAFSEAFRDLNQTDPAEDLDAPSAAPIPAATFSNNTRSSAIKVPLPQAASATTSATTTTTLLTVGSANITGESSSSFRDTNLGEQLSLPNQLSSLGAINSLVVPSSSPTSNSTMSSSMRSLHRPRTRTSFQASNLTRLLSSSPRIERLTSRRTSQSQPAGSKELLYGKNFPKYRKLYQYHIHHAKFFPKTKLFVSTGISPDLTRLALISEHKFEVYIVNTEKPEEQPKLLCCGRNTGEYGPSFELHSQVSKEDVLRYSNFGDSALSSLESLQHWEHICCRITHNLLVIAGTRGFLRIHDLNCDGRCIYTYQCKFPIRCVDVSPDERFIALGVIGKDKYSLAEQAFVILLSLQFEDVEEAISPYESTPQSDLSSGSATGVGFMSSSFHQTPLTPAVSAAGVTAVDSGGTAGTATASATTASATAAESTTTFPRMQKRRSVAKLVAYPFTLPYRDPITYLQFSPDSRLLAVATAMESRFLTINITEPNRPALVMKSQRKLDTSMDSEGITDIQFFPDSRLMVVTAVAFKTAPIIIDTNITSVTGPEGIARPRMLMKVLEVGGNIQRCCVSPRGDSVAFLDRSGTVYMMMCPQMNDSDPRQTVVVTDVANAYTARESAAMMFDRPGYKLYILDRKGVLSIADYTAGTVEDQSVTRCKIIS